MEKNKSSWELTYLLYPDKNNNHWPLLNTVSVLLILTLSHPTIVWARHWCYPHFTGETGEAREEMDQTSLQSFIEEMIDLEFWANSLSIHPSGLYPCNLILWISAVEIRGSLMFLPVPYPGFSLQLQLIGEENAPLSCGARSRAYSPCCGQEWPRWLFQTWKREAG